jgi:hypothetical protein
MFVPGPFALLRQHRKTLKIIRKPRIKLTGDLLLYRVFTVARRGAKMYA